jgi:hypothetical protein
MTLRPALIVTLTLTSIALDILPAAPASGGAQDRAAASGRLMGTVVDGAGAVLPGVTVTLTSGDKAPRQVETDQKGRFGFENVLADPAYAIRATLNGFIPDTEKVAVTNGETQIITLELDLGCGEPITVWLPDSDLLRMADAVAYLRVTTEEPVELPGNCGVTRTAVVLDATLFSSTGAKKGDRITLMGGSRFLPDREYVVMLKLSPRRKHPEFGFGVLWVRDVVAGRVREPDAGDVGIRDGVQVAEALTTLREQRDRHSR